MKVKGALNKKFLVRIGVIFCILFMVSYPSAETKSSKSKDTETKQKVAKIQKNFINPKQIKTTAKVMEVSTGEFYIVIAEKFFYVAEFKINGKLHRTELKDMSGKLITMDAFAERDLVEVTAIELEPQKGKYIALAIRILPPR